MLAGECPLFSAWGRFEDGAPAPHEHLAGDAPGGFALTLAGECPLCGAERLEDGAPARMSTYAAEGSARE